MTESTELPGPFTDFTPITFRIADEMKNTVQAILNSYGLAGYLSIAADQNGLFIATDGTHIPIKTFKNIFPFLTCMAKKTKGTTYDAQLIDKDRSMTLLCGGKVYTLELEAASMRNDEGSLAVEIVVANENDTKRLENFIGMLLPADKLTIDDAPDLREAMERTSIKWSSSEIYYLVKQAAKGLDINLDKARKLISKWHEIYPKAKAIQEAFSRSQISDLRPGEHQVCWRESVKSVDQLPEEAEDHDARWVEEDDDIYVYSAERKEWEITEKHLKAEESIKGKKTTPTGRSPSRPNLQNVNPRTELGSQIKEAFLPRSGRFQSKEPNLANQPRPEEDEIECNNCVKPLSKEEATWVQGDKFALCPKCHEEYKATVDEGLEILKFSREKMAEKKAKEVKVAWEPESNWDEHPNWSVQDWLESIAADNTRQGYHEWVRSQIENMLKNEEDQ